MKWKEGNKNILYIRPSKDFTWSGLVPIGPIRTYHFYCKALNNSKNIIFMNASVEQAGPIFYIMIKDILGEDIPYLI